MTVLTDVLCLAVYLMIINSHLTSLIFSQHLHYQSHRHNYQRVRVHI